MAHLLAGTLTLGCPAAPGSSLHPHRALSDKVELIETDLSEESASSTLFSHFPLCIQFRRLPPPLHNTVADLESLHWGVK